MNLELKDNEFKLFQELILEKSGLNFDDSKRKSLKVSLLSRIRYKGFDNYQQYYKYINFHPDGRTEFRDLVTLLTINETMFFRNTDQFKILKEHVLPIIINENRDKKIRIWSAGCSTGEEPYSIAIAMRELVGFTNNWNIEILGVDIDKTALAAAKEGLYKPRALRVTEKIYTDRYFKEVDGKYKINQEIRDMVSFDYYNLAEEPYPVALNGKWDIIFCRNVLIYFNTELIEKTIERFHEGIRDGGYLFIGYSEILSAYKNRFAPAKFDGVYIYKKDATEEIHGLTDAGSVVKEDDELPSIKEEKEKAEGLFKEAFEQLIKEDFDNALENIKESLKLDPLNPNAHMLSARLCFERGLYEEAHVSCDKSLGLNPFLPEAHYLQGIIYDKLNMEEKAIGKLEAAIRLNKKFTMAYFHLARMKSLLSLLAVLHQSC